MQPLGSVIDRIEGGHIGKQRLCGADIACGFISPNVLLSGLKRHAICRATLRIDRQSNDSARHQSNEIFFDGHEGGVRPTVAERNTKTLRRSDRNVCAHLTGRFD